jgi:hypothetical protein
MKPVVAIAAIVALIAIGAGGAAAADPIASAEDPVAFVDSAPLKITFDPEAGVALSKNTTVVIQNNTSADVTLSFSLILTDSKGQSADLAAPTTADALVPANSVKPIALVFAGDKAKPSLSGFLVASVAGLSSATRAVTIVVPEAAPEHLARNIILSAAGAALITFFLATFLVYRGRGSVLKTLLKRMGATEFSSKESWATTVAGAGGLVSAIGAGTGFIPAETTNLTKGEFTGLGLLFLAIPVVAALAYATLTTQEKKSKVGLQDQGFVVTFLIAGALTIGAVVGQVLTLAFLVKEATAKDVAASIDLAYLVVFGSAIVMSVLYGAVQMRRKVAVAFLATQPSKTSTRTFELPRNDAGNVKSFDAVRPDEEAIPATTML